MTEAANETHHAPPSPLGVATAFVLIYVSWGTTYYVTGHAMQELKMPPALFGGMRLVVAGVILLLYQAVRGQSLRLSTADFLRLIPISVFLFLLGNWLIMLGQREVKSGLAAILIATTPLWIGLFAAMWPGGETLYGRGWLGLVVGFIGVVVTLIPNVEAGAGMSHALHALLVLGSAACWGVGAILSRQLVVQLPHLTSAAYQMLMGGLMQVSLGSLLGEWPDLVDRVNEYAVIAFIYLLVVGSLTGFVAFNWLLVHVSAAKVGTYAYVNPIIAVFIGWVMNETHVDGWLLAGIVVVLIGVYLVRSDHVPAKELELEPD